jgi:hypothetical protein
MSSPSGLGFQARCTRLSTAAPGDRLAFGALMSGAAPPMGVTLIHRRDPAPRMARFYALAALAIGAAIELVAGCAQRPLPHAATRVQPPDWFHQQQAAARAARRAHQPQTDTVGAQKAYNDVLRTACTKAALAGPGKYPARCDAVLRVSAPTMAPSADTNPTPNQPTDPCVGDTDSQECSEARLKAAIDLVRCSGPVPAPREVDELPSSTPMRGQESNPTLQVGDAVLVIHPPEGSGGVRPCASGVRRATSDPSP